MSVDWPLRKLSDICDFLNNKRIPLKSLDRIKRQGDFPYYGASGVVDHIDDYVFDGTFLLISEDGENLRTRNTPIAFKASGKFWVNNHAHILAEREDGILDYLEYYFSQLDLSPYITGAVQPKLNKANLDSIEIPVPPIRERLYINQILNSFTNKIQLNRQTNQTLEHIAQALFKSWFVDFEPTRAKIVAKQAGQDPERAAMAAISGKTVAELDQLDAAQLTQLKTTAALFPDGLVESELGEVPEGWEVSPLSSMVELIGGGTPKKSESDYWNGDIPWFSVKDAPADGDVFVIDTELKITELGLNKSSTKLLPEGITIISARGTVGRLALVATATAMNQSCYGVRGIDGIGAYLNYLNLKEAVSTLQQNTHGAVFDTITKATFDTVSLVNASDEIKSAFEKAVEASFKQIKNNLFESKSLEASPYTQLHSSAHSLAI